MAIFLSSRDTVMTRQNILDCTELKGYRNQKSLSSKISKPVLSNNLRLALLFSGRLDWTTVPLASNTSGSFTKTIKTFVNRCLHFIDFKKIKL